MDTSGMSWVIGGLLAILAIALVIAGATGHAEQLFQGITGKKAGSSSSGLADGGQGVGPTNPVPSSGGILGDSTGANIDAVLAGLAAAGTAGAGPGAPNPYANLGPATTTNPAGSV